MKLKRPEWVGPDVQLADLLMHQAGHAVVAWELGVRIIELHFSLKAWSGLMPFAGAITSCFDRALAADAAREAAEKDMLIFHAGRMAQLLFHYDSVHGYRNSSDLRGVIDACRRVEDATAVIDAWSEYIEERVRVMLSAPGTWSRVLALAPEIARRLSLTGHQIAAFLEHVDVAGAVAPHDTPWNRDRYAIGRGIDALGLSNRSRTCLERSQIGTIAELVSYSRSDVRRLIRGAGEKTAQEIEAATHALGLTLAEESLLDRELRTDRARRPDVAALDPRRRHECTG